MQSVELLGITARGTYNYHLFLKGYVQLIGN